ncbi:MAG: amidase [Actinobacteria bacterium]|nr:amidase [Actinomycetota bacterium]
MTLDISAFGDDAMGDHDAVGLIEAMRSGNVHADELSAAALTRAHAVDERLNAIVAWAGAPISNPQPDAAVFAGVPAFVKDNENLAGLPTRHGSRATPATVAASNSPFIDAFLGAGFTVLGKSSMPEFGLTASTEPLLNGPARNPWSNGHSTGGSSGGSAALVAAGVVPIAHGNDGGGSIRIPASCCGLVGLKPSRGRLPVDAGLEGLPVAIVAQGVLTRSVRDTALFHAVAETPHATLPPIGHVTGPSATRLRIAFTADAMSGMPVHPDVVAVVDRTAVLCEGLGHHVERIPFPFGEQFGRDFLRYWAGLAFATEYGGRQMHGPAFDRHLLEPLTLGLSRYFRSVAVRTPASLRRLRAFGDEYARLLGSYDILLTPVLAHPAPPIGYLAPDLPFETHLRRLLRYSSFTAIQNVAGSPAISLPLGTSVDGLPIGVQAAAGVGQEAMLLGLAYELEEAAPWR